MRDVWKVNTVSKKKIVLNHFFCDAWSHHQNIPLFSSVETLDLNALDKLGQILGCAMEGPKLSTLNISSNSCVMMWPVCVWLLTCIDKLFISNSCLFCTAWCWFFSLAVSSSIYSVALRQTLDEKWGNSCPDNGCNDIAYWWWYFEILLMVNVCVASLPWLSFIPRCMVQYPHFTSCQMESRTLSFWCSQHVKNSAPFFW